MANLEQFINQPELCDWDALVKMAVILINLKASILL